ncbi:futalosine hydrolase [Paraflavitalea soli]|uniref:Futalosine hydrolase n=1 Tax=Paraflavitalea soli TaxID=2315862 RepID=A0A3B7MUP8_9BACT|nr:futalosine hydrolase [Paraflavitalea soli]AXY77818.1 futalosine hydrolase [Paraflavitalea soli]
MHILLIAATAFEIQPVIDFLQAPEHPLSGHTVSIQVTGIGSMSTTYYLTKSIREKRPDYVLQAGIGGSFSTHFSPGRVVLVEKEMTGDLGVEENGIFKDLFEMGLQKEGAHATTSKWLVNPHTINWENQGLALVNGVTVNEITTRASRIEQLQQNYGVTVESMEGAAFHFVCLQEGIPFLQIRSISNYVGERDKKAWKMKEAIAALNDQLINIFKTL